MGARYEIWFRDEPFYMASASRKTLKMLLKREPANIARFRRLAAQEGPA